MMSDNGTKNWKNEIKHTFTEITGHEVFLK